SPACDPRFQSKDRTLSAVCSPAAQKDLAAQHNCSGGYSASPTRRWSLLRLAFRPPVRTPRPGSRGGVQHSFPSRPPLHPSSLGWKTWQMSQEEIVQLAQTKNLTLAVVVVVEWQELTRVANSGQGACSGLSKEVLSKISGTVVSLASYNGYQFRCAYSGTVVHIDSFFTTVLTSANVMRSSEHSRWMEDFSTYVWLPSNEMVDGWTRDIDYDLNIAVINFRTVPGCREACLDHHIQSGYNSNVVALRRDFESGDLTYSTGVVTDRSSESYGGSMIATCKFIEIQVYLPNKRCAKGKLKHYDLQYNIAIVTIRGYHCRRTAKIDIKEPVEPHNGVVAIGRTFETGKLMATSGMLTTESIELDCDELAFSTCKITKAGIGGPLMDFRGNFIGMNFYGVKRTPYLPRNVILEQLRRLDGKETVAAAAIHKPKPNRWPVREAYWHYPNAEPRDNWPSRKLL
ncbi:hypothetical protein EJB05_03301, partial [Eragrostis curvula]